jgi:sulfoxide reductase heme-binding subunit YedZ
MIGAVSAGVPIAWLVARAAGLVAFGLLTISVWLGLAMSTRLLSPRRQKALLGWHQTLIWTGLGMVVLHGGALLLDPTLHFGVFVVLVPGASSWRPVGVAAGVVTAWLMLMLALSFRFRRRIGYRRWRLLHFAAFAAFALALGHGLAVGTDLRGGAGLAVAVLAGGPALWLVFFRILMPRSLPDRAPPPPSAARPAVGSTGRPAGPGQLVASIRARL